MQFSESWLRSFVDPALDGEQLAELLTMAGLEVEERTPVAEPFSGVVVGRIDAVEAHPNADKLRLCRVDVGAAAPLAIVCGAPNAAVGLRVPCATVGAQLPGMRIAAAKVRGVESFGMLCSARELGLSEEHAGLLELPAQAPVGADLRDYLDLDDHRLLLKLTPNRPDCLGIYGIAREVAALTGARLAPLPVSAAPVTCDDRLPVKVSAPELCGRFSGRVIRGVNARAATPEWMRRRLERSGQRPISALVDISNYVMFEMNRPSHVFDLERLNGALEVRWAREGESLVLLNGEKLTLAPDVGVIACGGEVESLAGIMGGERTAVSLDTSSIYVEAAFWWPQAIQGRARRYGFSSDAGHRFERGADFADTVAGVERVTQLILEICGGRAGPLDDQVLDLPRRASVAVRPARVAKVLGMAMDRARMHHHLDRLGLAPADDGEVIRITPPSYRFDLEIEEDVIEEIARLQGYEAIPAAAPRGVLTMAPRPEDRRELAALRRTLVLRDYQEVINFSFVEADWECDLTGSDRPLRLANPIASHLSVMRSSLVGGLVANLAANLRRRIERVRVFEIGRCFAHVASAEDTVPGFAQPLRLAGLISGPAAPEQWGMTTRRVDFFDAKGDVEALFAPHPVSFEVAAHVALHPGRSAAIVCAGRPVGVLGELHPRWVQKYELGSPPVVFEIALDVLLARTLPQYAATSRLPAVVRDLALLVPQSVSAQQLTALLREVAPESVRSVELFDFYQGKGVPAGMKSLAFRILLQDTARTLGDAEVEAAVAKLVAAATDRVAAQLRT